MGLRGSGGGSGFRLFQRLRSRFHRPAKRFRRGSGVRQGFQGRVRRGSGVRFQRFRSLRSGFQGFRGSEVRHWFQGSDFTGLGILEAQAEFG